MKDDKPIFTFLTAIILLIVFFVLLGVLALIVECTLAVVLTYGGEILGLSFPKYLIHLLTILIICANIKLVKGDKK